MIVAGRLTGTVGGCPVVIDADDSGVVVTATTVRTAWASRRSVGSLLPVLAMLKRHGVPLRLNIAGFVTVELLPRPSTLARIAAPRLSCLT